LKRLSPLQRISEAAISPALSAKMPFEIHDEIAVSTGMLKDWITTAEVKQALILDEEVNQDLVARFN
jgi:hypothetical protein